MTDIEIIYKCVFDKTYQNKVEFLIQLEKVSDRKLIAGLLIDLSIKSKGYDSDKDQILEICAELLSQEELETNYLFEANTYYQNILSNLNKEKTDETKFLLDFYSYLLKENDDVSEDIKGILNQDTINIDDLLKNNKQYLPSLKQRMIDSELYEAIPLIDKYI